MRPRIIGRALGIGVRVAGRIAGQRLAAHAQSGAGAPQARLAQPIAGTVAQARAAGHMAAQVKCGIGRGIGGFLRPFRRVGGIVWLEVTGVFFLLFAALFAFRLWQNWARLARDPVPRNLVIAAAAVFFYLGVSSFWRARHR